MKKLLSICVIAFVLIFQQSVLISNAQSTIVRPSNSDDIMDDNTFNSNPTSFGGFGGLNIEVGGDEGGEESSGESEGFFSTLAGYVSGAAFTVVNAVATVAYSVGLTSIGDAVTGFGYSFASNVASPQGLGAVAAGTVVSAVTGGIGGAILGNLTTTGIQGVTSAINSSQTPAPVQEGPTVSNAPDNRKSNLISNPGNGQTPAYVPNIPVGSGDEPSCSGLTGSALTACQASAGASSCSTRGGMAMWGAGVYLGCIEANGSNTQAQSGDTPTYTTNIFGGTKSAGGQIWESYLCKHTCYNGNAKYFKNSSGNYFVSGSRSCAVGGTLYAIATNIGTPGAQYSTTFRDAVTGVDVSSNVRNMTPMGSSSDVPQCSSTALNTIQNISGGNKKNIEPGVSHRDGDTNSVGVIIPRTLDIEEIINPSILNIVREWAGLPVVSDPSRSMPQGVVNSSNQPAKIVTAPSDVINLGTAAAQDRLTSSNSFLRYENLNWNTLCSNASIKPVLTQNNPKTDYDRQFKAGLEVYPFDMTSDANFSGMFGGVGIMSSAATPVYGFISDTPCAGTATNVYRFNGGIGGTNGNIFSTNNTQALSDGNTGIIKITPGRWYITLLWGSGEVPNVQSQNYAAYANGTARLNVRFDNRLIGTTGVSNNTATSLAQTRVGPWLWKQDVFCPDTLANATSSYPLANSYGWQNVGNTYYSGNSLPTSCSAGKQFVHHIINTGATCYVYSCE